MRRALLALVALLALAGCVPPSESGGMDDRGVVQPCYAAMGSQATLVAETLNRQGELTRHQVQVATDAIDSEGGHGINTDTGRPFNGEPLVKWSPWCYSFVRVGKAPPTLHVSFSVYYTSAEAGEILTCYRLDNAGLEVATSHRTVQAKVANERLHVVCLEDIF